jgi:hypothetical protein
MYSSRELVDALLARPRRRLWFRDQAVETPPGEFPPGWQGWFAALRAQPGKVTGAPAPEFLAIFLAREPALPPRRSADLSNWQVFNALWRQQWHAAEPDQGRDRIAAMSISVLVHLLFVLVLSLLAYLRGPLPPARQGEDVVQLEYIGQGTPEDTGGGTPQAETVIELPEASAAARPDASPPPSAAAAPQPETTPEPTPPSPQAPAPPQPQPLQITETPEPDSPFVLPPTTAPELANAPSPVTRPTVQVIERQVELVETPVPPTVRPELVQQPQPAPQVRAPDARPRQREIPLLTRAPELPGVAQQPQPAPTIQAPAQQVRTRDVPLARSTGQQPTPRPASGTATATRPATTGATPAPGAAAPSGRPAASSGERAANAAGRGTSPSATPGALPSTQRGDDWGDSLRNRPGGTAGTPSGLYNADGSPRLPPGTAAPGGGFPPGSDNWSRDQLDRHGTWSKRSPIGHDPTRFDQYWIPSGTLLQEWVRRGVKTLAIPIPGSSKKINCTISILQLGGGCGISDPNLQDQEAIARPPPDIPYKPELQEQGP